MLESSLNIPLGWKLAVELVIMVFQNEYWHRIRTDRHACQNHSLDTIHNSL